MPQPQRERLLSYLELELKSPAGESPDSASNGLTTGPNLRDARASRHDQIIWVFKIHLHQKLGAGRHFSARTSSLGYDVAAVLAGQRLGRILHFVGSYKFDL